MRIRVFDTTLRDGEQSPGVALRPESKLEIAMLLDKLGVDVIEAGFPITSAGEMEGARLIASAGMKAEVCGLARAEKKDIDAVIDTGIRYVHIFIATSDIHLKDKLRITRKEALDKAVSAVAYAKSMGMRVEFSAEDATRTDIEFLKEVYRAVERAGADRINIPDTVGCASPEFMAHMTREIVSAVSLPVSVHCHDDLGLAVANSIAAIEAGAQCVHATVNGVGERAGNAALEEVAAAISYLKLGKEYYTNVDLRYAYEASLLVSKLFGMAVQSNKAIVGANAFTHESGVHTHGILTNRETYEFMDPASFGRETRIVSGKHAGMHGISAILERHDMNLSKEELVQVLDRVKRAGDDGKSVCDDDLLAMAKEVSVGRPSG
jgi:2-isopropylmalate synthase